MKKIKRLFAGITFCVFMMMLFSGVIQAKTTKAPKYSLLNVTEAEQVQGEWQSTEDGVRFVKEDGTCVQKRWISVDNKIYYLNASGRMVKGWVKYRSKFYYMNEDGSLRFGWLESNGKVYYLNQDGTRASGLQKIDKQKYFFDEKTGAARTGWIKIKKNTYYFSPKNSRMVKSSWVKTDKKYYYVTGSGKKKKSGWLTIGDKKYYLDKNGARVTGDILIKGKGYHFTKKGVYDPTVEVKDVINPKKPMVALTFDDGPGQYTERLLKCLEKNDAKATFFMVGSNVPNYKSAVKKMVSLGCELGNHSYSHANLAGLSSAAIQSEVQRTNKNIKSAAGAEPTVFRLPYGSGASSQYVLSALGLPSIYWSIDTRDWANTGSPQHTVNEVLNYVKSGDIVLMHDIHRSTVIAAETIIPALKKRGYQMVTVSQLAKYKGKTTLKKGKTYYEFR